MLVLPEEDKIFFLCWLHHSIFNINVVLQIDQLKKLISEGKKRVRKINYTPRLILCRLKENSSPNIAPGREILLFINTKWNFTVPQRVWVLKGHLKGRFLISPKHVDREQQVQWPMTDCTGTPWLGVDLEDAHQNYLKMAKPAWPHLRETPFQDQPSLALSHREKL